MTNNALDDFENGGPENGDISEERALTFVELIQAVMSQAQFDILCGKTPPYAIQVRRGKGGGYRYISHGYVRSVLNRAFGFDYDFELLPVFNGMPYVVNDTQATKTISAGRDVTVMGKLTVRIRDRDNIKHVIATIVKQEAGGQPWLDGQDFNDAIKGASSDAFKRCALNLGVGLDLYYDEEQRMETYEQQQQMLARIKQPAGKSLKDLGSKS